MMVMYNVFTIVKFKTLILFTLNVLIIILIASISGVGTAYATPYFDISYFTDDPDYIVIVGNVTGGEKVSGEYYSGPIYDITVEHYISNPLEKDIIHTFSQPPPTSGRGGTNYSYFDIGDRVILVLYSNSNTKQIEEFPSTYNIVDFINPHNLERELQTIPSPLEQKKRLIEFFSGTYYEYRHLPIACNLGLVKIYKQNTNYASCVTESTHEQLLQRKWLKENPLAVDDLNKNIDVVLFTNKTQYNLKDNVLITVTNNGDVPIKMNYGFGQLSVTNKSLEKDVPIWYFTDSDLQDSHTGVLLMPGASRTVERNLWNENYFVPGDYEISFTYSSVSKGKTIYFTSNTQFKII